MHHQKRLRMTRTGGVEEKGEISYPKEKLKVSGVNYHARNQRETRALLHCTVRRRLMISLSSLAAMVGGETKNKKERNQITAENLRTGTSLLLTSRQSPRRSKVSQKKRKFMKINQRKKLNRSQGRWGRGGWNLLRGVNPKRAPEPPKQVTATIRWMKKRESLTACWSITVKRSQLHMSRAAGWMILQNRCLCKRVTCPTIPATRGGIEPGNQSLGPRRLEQLLCRRSQHPRPSQIAQPEDTTGPIPFRKRCLRGMFILICPTVTTWHRGLQRFEGDERRLCRNTLTIPLIEPLIDSYSTNSLHKEISCSCCL